MRPPRVPRFGVTASRAFTRAHKCHSRFSSRHRRHLRATARQSRLLLPSPPPVPPPQASDQPRQRRVGSAIQRLLRALTTVARLTGSPPTASTGSIQDRSIVTRWKRPTVAIAPGVSNWESRAVPAKAAVEAAAEVPVSTTTETARSHALHPRGPRFHAVR